MADRFPAIDLAKPVGVRLPAAVRAEIAYQIEQRVDDLTKADVGLSQAANLAPANYPVSQAQADADTAVLNEALEAVSQIAGETRFVTNVGTGSPGPYEITHGFGTRDWRYAVRRNPGHPDNIGLTAPRNPAEYIDVQAYPHPTDLNKAYLDPGEVWAVNQMHLVMTRVGGEDTTAPTGATLGQSNITPTSVRVTAMGAADNTAVSVYEWDNDGTVVGRTVPATPYWDYTGLTPGTVYPNLGCTVVDLQGNRTRTSRSSTTAASSGVAFVKSVSGRSDTNVSTYDLVITPDAVSGGALVAAVGVSHLGGNWDVPDSYGVKSVVDITDGNAALTYLGGVGIGQGTQETGGALLFGRVGGGNPGVPHTIRISMTTQGNNQAIRGAVAQLSGVASFGAAVKQAASPSNRAASVGPVAAATGDLVIGALVANAAMTPDVGTTRENLGAVIGGNGDYLALVTAPGAGGNITLTTSSTAHQIGGVAANAVKA